MHDDGQTAAPDPRDAADRERREFLVRLSLLFGAIAGLLAGLPIVGYLLGPVLRPKRDQWIDLGPVDGFPVNQTRLTRFVDPLNEPWDGYVANNAAYVRRLTGDDFWVFSINCAHLGCPVSWFPESGLFLCPCHGGVYYEDGSYASGPPPRGLYHYDYRVKKGRLEIFGGHLPTLHDTFRDEVAEKFSSRVADHRGIEERERSQPRAPEESKPLRDANSKTTA